jgi:DNA-binding transcriptional MerR regulator
LFFCLCLPKQSQINDLERLTGIKAHTIRIWEKRYDLIQPHRTPTNIRYYDEIQLKKILNVSTLLENGYKISKVSSMKDDDISKVIQKIQTDPNDDHAINAYINDLIIAMLSYDEINFEKIFSALVLRYGLYDAMLKVIYPFLVKTGILWISSKAMPSQEHFATCLLKRKLMSATDGLPAPTRFDKKFLLYLPAEEFHEISLMLSDYVIRKAGYLTIMVGQNLPSRNLDDLLKKTGVTHALTFNISRKKPTDLQSHLAAIKRNNKNIQFYIGGSPEMVFDFKHIKNLTILHHPNELISALK